MGLRGHEPVVIDNFKGLFERGDPESVPVDHFTQAQNLVHIGNNITVRPGIGISQDVAAPLLDIRRIYNYPTQTANTLIMLAMNVDGVTGEIYHFVNSTTVFGPILSVVGMTDFAFLPYAGRGYISPFGTFQTGDINIQKGLEDEFLYVYAGDGTNARPAAGPLPSPVDLDIANGAAGHTDAGQHIFAFVGETDSGFYSQPVGMETFTTSANLSVSFGDVPVFDGPQWVRRHLVASAVITNFNGNLEGYQLFFVPNATIENNTDTFLNNISFFDADLLDDASHLFDNYITIPAGAALSLYHDRLCLSTTFDDISLVLVSAEGEPEAISQIDGQIIVPLDGNPITNHQELRDVFYTFKRSRTCSYTDNGEEPSSWPLTVVDNALGCPVHGIATVLDSGSSSVDYLIITTFAGIQLFNGKYLSPELSWKIQDLWFNQDRNLFRDIQVVNAPIQKWILVILPDGRVLCGDYANGMDPKNMRWEPWKFLMKVNSIAIWNIDSIIIGSPLTGALQ
jgi:hypothetical protein